MTVSEIFKTHEKLILALIAAGVLWVAIGKVDTLIQHHDDANLKQAQVIAAQEASKNAAIAAQVASDKASVRRATNEVTSRRCRACTSKCCSSNRFD